MAAMALRDTARSARDQALVLDFSSWRDVFFCNYIMPQATANAAELEEVGTFAGQADDSYLTRSRP